MTHLLSRMALVALLVVSSQPGFALSPSSPSGRRAAHVEPFDGVFRLLATVTASEARAPRVDVTLRLLPFVSRVIDVAGVDRDRAVALTVTTLRATDDRGRAYRATFLALRADDRSLRASYRLDPPLAVDARTLTLVYPPAAPLGGSSGSSSGLFSGLTLTLPVAAGPS